MKYKYWNIAIAPFQGFISRAHHNTRMCFLAKAVKYLSNLRHPEPVHPKVHGSLHHVFATPNQLTCQFKSLELTINMPESQAVGKLPPGYCLESGVPSIAEYRELRKLSGLTPVTEAQAAPVSSGSWYGCHITYRKTEDERPRAVAMGRIIGDGGWYFLIADMATLPEHQRKGLGSIILTHLLAYIKENSPDDGIPYVNVMADPPGRKLYANNGFVASETYDELGMVLLMQK
ncbi:hypothetical protein KVR01_013234 [Diaporthe batatas]|uniref:uncharacterized protein n=1 Tax=Diaporthe batatas TaxID=748121 RepID=UPI001D04157F|nr:uncharacterized protein KVR01_013234 [Diaporthe batatas]KAG8157012.1 hypothetical protein KVR01_013234 [Diaporthe batatas]